MSPKDQLSIPDAANGDAQSFELIRIWIANQSQHVTMRVGVWDDPAQWGMMLADLAGHVAKGYEQSEGVSRALVLERIHEAFNAHFAQVEQSPDQADSLPGGYR
jgi:hypothetical protein